MRAELGLEEWQPLDGVALAEHLGIEVIIGVSIELFRWRVNHTGVSQLARTRGH